MELGLTQIRKMAEKKAALYALRGSEYVAKVALALAYKGVPFEYQFADFSRKDRAKYFPRRSPEAKHAYVHLPVVKFGNGDVVVESSDILKYLDDNFSEAQPEKIYPEGKEDEVRALEKRMAGTLYFGGMMLTGEDETHFKNSVGKGATEFAPPVVKTIVSVPPFRGLFLKAAHKVFRGQQRQKLESEAPQFKNWIGINYDDLKAEVMKEYAVMNSYLAESSTPFFFDSKGPTAADFMLHAVMHRLGGDNFGAFPPVLGNYKEVFGDYPSLVEHFEILNSNKWVANNVTYKYTDTAGKQADRTPLGVPVNPEKCPE